LVLGAHQNARGKAAKYSIQENCFSVIPTEELKMERDRFFDKGSGVFRLTSSGVVPDEGFLML
jgi:hypothetical protein